MIHLTASLTRDFVIGANGDQPWYIPDDLALFKQLTINHTVIMGWKTFNTPRLRQPLPDRHNIVLSHIPRDIPEVTVCLSIPEALEQAKQQSSEIFVIGGTSVYEQFLPLADWLHLSWVKKPYVGDVYFPRFKANDWVQVVEKNFDAFTYMEYKRKNA